MSHEYVLWIALAAYGLHVLEEFELNWRDWARHVLRLPVEWPSFYVVNALVVVLGVCAAGIVTLSVRQALDGRSATRSPAWMARCREEHLARGVRRRRADRSAR